MKITYAQVSSTYRRINHRHDLYRLRKGCKVRCEANIEPDTDKEYYIYSPYSETLYKTRVKEMTNWDMLDKFIQEGNVFSCK